jgi:hypothetical protein
VEDKTKAGGFYMIDEDTFFTCPLCGKPIGGWDKHNNVIWCDNKECALIEEVSIALWVSIHEVIKNA